MKRSKNPPAKRREARIDQRRIKPEIVAVRKRERATDSDKETSRATSDRIK